MSTQLDLFCTADGDVPANAPAGFRYQPDLIDAATEHALVEQLRTLPFRHFEFHGYTGKRRVVSFGWQYDFGTGDLRRTGENPGFLLPLRALAARFAGLPPPALVQALVTEYSAGAGIGWHRDKAVFGEVVCISLLAPCVLRFRRAGQATWDRINVQVQPRSAYVLSGEARDQWEHSIAPMQCCVTRSRFVVCAAESVGRSRRTLGSREYSRYRSVY